MQTIARRILPIIATLTALLLPAGSVQAGLIAWYQFGSGANAGADSTGNGHAGTLGGSAVTAAAAAGHPAYVTNALLLNGGTDGMALNVAGTINSLTTLNSNDAFTIGFWETPSGNPVAQYNFYAQGAAGGDTRTISTHVPWSDGTIYFDSAGCCGGTQRLSQSASASQYTGWNQWTFVKDATGNKSMYVNGTLFLSGAGFASINNATYLIQAFEIGNTFSTNQAYLGQLADFAIFNNALTAGEVNQLVTLGAGSFVPEPTSLAVFAFGAVGTLVLARRRRQA